MRSQPAGRKLAYISQSRARYPLLITVISLASLPWEPSVLTFPTSVPSLDNVDLQFTGCRPELALTWSDPALLLSVNHTPQEFPLPSVIPIPIYLPHGLRHTLSDPQLTLDVQFSLFLQYYADPMHLLSITATAFWWYQTIRPLPMASSSIQTTLPSAPIYFSTHNGHAAHLIVNDSLSQPTLSSQHAESSPTSS